MTTRAIDSMRAPQVGATVGRFVVEELVATDDLGHVVRAKDTKTGALVSLRLLPERLLTDERGRRLRKECRAAAGLKHPNIVATYGAGPVDGGGLYVARQWVRGAPLSEVLRERDTPLPAWDACNLVAHLCQALDYAHATMIHGAIRPSAVWVGADRRVLLSDLGVGRVIVEDLGATVLAAEAAYVAPEVRAGRPADKRSDVYGLGATLFAMLTLEAPGDPARGWDATEHAGEALAAGGVALQQVLMACLAASPDERFEQPSEVRAALLALVAAGGAVSNDAPALDLEIDIDLSVAREGQLASSDSPGSPARALAASPERNSMPSVGMRVSLSDSFRGPAASSPPVVQATEVDLSVLLQKISEHDAERWTVTVDGLDHGPFTGRDLVEQIVRGEVKEEHRLRNLDTGDARPAAQWEEFTEFFVEQKSRIRQAAQVKAVQATERVEKLTGRFKLAVAASVVGVLVLTGAVFVLTRGAGRESARRGSTGDLYERGEIAFEASADMLPDPPRDAARQGRRGAGGGSGGGGGGGGGGGASYEDAMNRPVELGDVSRGGGERRLTPAEVTQVMNTQVNVIFRTCVVPEVRAGGALKEVTIDLAISGDGTVLGASAGQGSSSFKTCINKSVRNIRFPKFPAPRMGTRYRFRVD